MGRYNDRTNRYHRHERTLSGFDRLQRYSIDDTTGRKGCFAGIGNLEDHADLPIGQLPDKIGTAQDTAQPEENIAGNLVNGSWSVDIAGDLQIVD